MRVYKEMTVSEFEFWSGAKQTVNILTEDELETIWEYLEETAPEEGMDEVEINDFFWFEDEVIADILGWPSYEDLWEARNNSEIFFNNYEEYEEYMNSQEDDGE